MDFTLPTEAELLRDLTGTILSDRATPTRHAELDRAGGWWDLETHRLLAESGVVGATIPEQFGGTGLSQLELHLALVEVGAHAARVPLWEVAVVTRALAAHGTDAQCDHHLARLAAGEVSVVPALVEHGVSDPTRPRTTAHREGTRWRINGGKTQVARFGTDTDFLVSAVTEEGTGLFLVPAGTPGVLTEEQNSVTQRPGLRLTLTDVVVDDTARVGGVDSAAHADVLRHAVAALASIGAGVSRGALGAAAEYTSAREQFGQPIGTFQAVRQRLADAWIDVRAMEVTALQAAWCLSTGADAEHAVDVAKFWAADGGHRVLHTVQHVHGGMGIDLDNHLHHRYRMAKWVEFTLGTATHQLRRIGASLSTL